jgi:hypothetical protein
MCLFVEQMCLHNVLDQVLASQAGAEIPHLVWTQLRLEILKLVTQVIYKIVKFRLIFRI